MKPGRTALTGALGLAPLAALAHGAIPGSTPFYVGLLHPLQALGGFRTTHNH